MVLLDEIHHICVKFFLNLEKFYLRIWVKWGQNGGN